MAGGWVLAVGLQTTAPEINGQMCARASGLVEHQAKSMQPVDTDVMVNWKKINHYLSLGDNALVLLYTM